jgi:hypothetical protein
MRRVDAMPWAMQTRCQARRGGAAPAPQTPVAERQVHVPAPLQRAGPFPVSASAQLHERANDANAVTQVERRVDAKVVFEGFGVHRGTLRPLKLQAGARAEPKHEAARFELHTTS